MDRKEAHSKMIELTVEIRDIEAQLANKDRQVDGERLGDVEYHQWRAKAVHAMKSKSNEYQTLKKNHGKPYSDGMWEYHVEPFDISTKSEEMEERMNELGLDLWEAIGTSVGRDGSGIRLFFKRRAKF